MIQFKRPPAQPLTLREPRSRVRVSALIAITMAISHAQAADRLELEARVRAAPPSSVDQRFQIDARLRPANASSGDQRFQLSSRIIPRDNAKAVAAVCNATDALFKNGFEN